MDIDEFLQRLEQAVTLQGDDAAIRIQAEYEPQGGWGAKVFPPTYLPSNGTKYHFEQRWGDGDDPIDVVILDSYQSQANRAEAALKENVTALGLPQIVMEVEVDGRTVQISTLDAPHRSRDAYFLDSEADGKPFDQTEVGKALNGATAENATAFLRFAPYDLIYGVWDSHRGKRIALKFPRAYTSEMLGWHAVRGYRAATKGDPLNLASRDKVPVSDWRSGTTTGQGKKEHVALSELGHGMVPGEPDDEAGGVSVRAITRAAVLSLNGLARFGFPITGGTDATAAGRTALAAVALLADRLAFGGAGLHLRSGSDLTLAGERIEWVCRGGVAEPFDLSRENARALFVAARRRLEEGGVDWSGDPIRLRPTARLKGAIERTFQVVELDGEA